MLARHFDLIPAIDVLEGRAVRLAGGRREAVTLEEGDPAELARRYAAEGANRLHLVDLDGAFAGAPSLDLLERVATAGGLPLQVGGGYRSLDAIGSALAAGADRVMVGTAALDEAFLERAARRFGAALVVAVDVRDGRVTTDGWTRSSGTSAAQLASRCAAARVGRLLVTSAARDGSLAGPDVALLGEVLPRRDSGARRRRDRVDRRPGRHFVTSAAKVPSRGARSSPGGSPCRTLSWRWRRVDPVYDTRRHGGGTSRAHSARARTEGGQPASAAGRSSFAGRRRRASRTEGLRGSSSAAAPNERRTCSAAGVP